MQTTRILVVDDEATSRDGLEKLLRLEGFLTMGAPDGASALEQARATLPDLVLTDLRMPIMDGLELCRRLLEIDPDLPVIVTTGFDESRLVVECFRAGAVDYLVKPLDLDAVLLCVRRGLDRRAAKVEQAQLRARAQELYERAASAARASEEVLSIVAHDLRSPLSIIHLQASRLTRLEPDHPEQTLRSISESILNATAQMSRLIDDLLDEARLRSGHVHLSCARHRLGNLLGDVAELRPLALPKQIRLCVEPAPDGVVCCDRARIAQVLANLVDNAIRFSPRGSTVFVTGSAVDGGARFAVRDQGPGIAADAAERIFDRFWQPKGSARGGLGLGLYIAKGIVEAHHGRIWVESVPGVGSTFHVSIPAAPL